MRGDRRRDRQKSEGGSESSLERREAATPRALRTTQDSLYPVRVPVRSVRPPLSLWARAWATVALVIAVAGGAIGIVAGLRARTLGSDDRSAPGDRPPPAAGAQVSPDHSVAAKEAAVRVAMPAAAPGFTAPPPLAPVQGVSRSAASSSAVAFRTPESLAVSPPLAPASGAALSFSKRPKAAEAAPPTIAIPRPPAESAPAPAPAPATSDAPETQGASEAWVTEERGF
jgi:hypothetical protein